MCLIVVGFNKGLKKKFIISPLFINFMNFIKFIIEKIIISPLFINL